MPRIAYVNGRYVPKADGHVSIEDRGFQFADGVYEVWLCVGGRLLDFEGHLARLARSLAALRITAPMSARALALVLRELLRRNRLADVDSLVYLQVTRGAAPRNHAFPAGAVAPSLVITAKPFDLSKADAVAARGVKVISAPDERWARVDIKTVGLLPNCLAKQKAAEAGAVEAWLVKGEMVTEGASSNAWIVDAAGDLITHPLGTSILGGITRDTVLRIAASLQLRVVERAFSLKEAFAAREAFLTSATQLVTPIIAIDGHPVGPGAPGPIARRLRDAYLAAALN